MKQETIIRLRSKEDKKLKQELLDKASKDWTDAKELFNIDI